MDCPSARQELSQLLCVFWSRIFTKKLKVVDSGFQRHKRKVSPFSCSVAAGHSHPVVWGWTLGVIAVFIQLSEAGSWFVGCSQDQEVLPEERWYLKPPVLI